jgi:predicted TIM-barrel fold metal-dependent hydrolase
MIIDAHAHACGEFANPETLIRILDELGVAKVALCPGLKGHTSAPPLPNIPITAIKQSYFYSQYFINPGLRFNYNFLLKEQQDGNQFVYSLVEKCPDRIIQVYWLDPRKPDFMVKLKNDFDRWRFRGIKLHQVCTPFEIDNYEIEQIASFGQERQLPLFIHLRSNKDARKMMSVAKNYPGINVVLLHLIGLEEVIEDASMLKNIHYEISAYSYISERRLKYAIDNLGASRIILGSDTPWDKSSLKNNIARVNRLSIGNDEKERILGGNTTKILKL